jgi:hypothetical protein
MSFHLDRRFKYKEAKSDHKVVWQHTNLGPNNFAIPHVVNASWFQWDINLVYSLSAFV